MAVRVTIEGADELRRKLRELAEGASLVVGKATEAGGEEVERYAEQRAPGPHIVTELQKVTRTRGLVRIGPDKKHWYYRFLEMGTRPHQIIGNEWLMFGGREGFVRTHQVDHPGMAARPFLRPAIKRRKIISQRAGKIFRRMLMGVAR